MSSNFGNKIILCIFGGIMISDITHIMNKKFVCNGLFSPIITYHDDLCYIMTKNLLSLVASLTLYNMLKSK